MRNPVDHRGVVAIDPERCFGKPCIRNMRINVFDVVRYFAAGMTEAEILEEWPELTEDDILAATPT